MSKPIEETNDTPEPKLPVFLRLPKPGERCELTGMSRTTMCELTAPSKHNNFSPPVKSYVQKTSANAKRGIRLIETQSLLAHIRSLPASALN